MTSGRRPINPRTNIPWTVPTLLAALQEANAIANQRAEDHDMCSTWEDILTEITEVTGLPFKGRPQPMSYSFTLDIVWRTEDPNIEVLRNLVRNQILVEDSIEDVEVMG